MRKIRGSPAPLRARVYAPADRGVQRVARHGWRLLTRALRAGLGWQQAQLLSEAEVESKLFVHIGRSEPDVRSAADFPSVHRSLRVTA